jgi:hypothetical protein
MVHEGGPILDGVRPRGWFERRGWPQEPARHRSRRPGPAHRLGLPGHRTPGRDPATGRSSTPVRAPPRSRSLAAASWTVSSASGNASSRSSGMGRPLRIEAPQVPASRRASARSRAAHRSPSRSLRAWLVSSVTPAVGAVHLVLRAGRDDRVVVVASHCSAQLLESATLLVQQGSRPRLVHPRSSSATWPADCLFVGQCPTGRHGGGLRVKLLGDGIAIVSYQPLTRMCRCLLAW